MLVWMNWFVGLFVFGEIWYVFLGVGRLRVRCLRCDVGGDDDFVVDLIGR